MSIEETESSIWQIDFSSRLKNDLESLGISAAEIYEPHGIIVQFKTNEDLNLYRLTGKFKEDYYLMFCGPADLKQTELLLHSFKDYYAYANYKKNKK